MTLTGLWSKILYQARNMKFLIEAEIIGPQAGSIVKVKTFISFAT